MNARASFNPKDIKRVEPFKIACYMCAHMDIAVETGYCDTCRGAGWSMDCAKDQWKFNENDTGLSEYRKILRTAETCKYFKAADYVIEEEKKYGR